MHFRLQQHELGTDYQRVSPRHRPWSRSNGCWKRCCLGAASHIHDYHYLRAVICIASTLSLAPHLPWFCVVSVYRVPAVLLNYIPRKSFLYYITKQCVWKLETNEDQQVSGWCVHSASYQQQFLLQHSLCTGNDKHGVMNITEEIRKWMLNHFEQNFVFAITTTMAINFQDEVWQVL